MVLVKRVFYVRYVKLLRLSMVIIMGCSVTFFIFYSRECSILQKHYKTLTWFLRIGPHHHRMTESTWNITLRNTTGIRETVVRTKPNVRKVFWTFLQLNGDLYTCILNNKIEYWKYWLNLYFLFSFVLKSKNRTNVLHFIQFMLRFSITWSLWSLYIVPISLNIRTEVWIWTYSNCNVLQLTRVC